MDLKDEKDTLYLQMAEINKTSATYRCEISPSNFNPSSMKGIR